MQWLTAGRGIVHCEMFPLLDRDRPEPVRAVPDLAQPARRRQDGRPVLHDALGRGPPPAHRHRPTTGRTHRDHDHRRRARRAAPAARRRRTRGRHAPKPTSRSGTSCSSPARSWSCRRPRRRRRSARSMCSKARSRVGGHDARRADRRGAPRRRAVDDHRAAPAAPRRSCCRAGRSASRSRSTGRS